MKAVQLAEQRQLYIKFTQPLLIYLSKIQLLPGSIKQTMKQLPAPVHCLANRRPRMKEIKQSICPEIPSGPQQPRIHRGSRHGGFDFAMMRLERLERMEVVINDERFWKAVISVFQHQQCDSHQLQLLTHQLQHHHHPALNLYSSTPASALAPPAPPRPAPPSFRLVSMAISSARTSNTSFGTVRSYMEIKSLGCGYT